MNLFILALTAYHAFLFKTIQINISSYFETILMILGVCILITFIVGIFIRKFEITSEIMWFIFNGLFEYDTVDMVEYFKINIVRLLFYEGAVALAVVVASKII